MIKLNLGCGQNLKEGYINVDKFNSFSPDVVCDLEVTPWPFESNSVDEITMYHVLEHLGADVNVFFAVMKEMYRVCAPGAVIHIAVPHPRSDSFDGDPTHVRPINQYVMSLFSKKRNLECQENGWPDTPLATYLDVDFDMAHFSMSLTPHWTEKYSSGKVSTEEIDFAIQTYFNVVQEIKFDLIAVK